MNGGPFVDKSDPEHIGKPANWHALYKNSIKSAPGAILVFCEANYVLKNALEGENPSGTVIFYATSGIKNPAPVAAGVYRELKIRTPSEHCKFTRDSDVRPEKTWQCTLPRTSIPKHTDTPLQSP